MISNEYVPMTDLLAHRAASESTRAAVMCGLPDQLRSLSFGEWHARSVAVGDDLRADGIQPSDRVALLFSGRDWTLYVVAFLAVAFAGAVAVPVSDQLPNRDLEFILRDCQARAVMSPDASRPVRGAVVPNAALKSLLGLRASPSTECRRPEGCPHAGDAAQILYTSGTTGHHKGVLATHGNLSYGCTMKSNRRPLRHSEHFLHAFPIGTNAGQVMLMNALDAHATAICLPRFLPGEVGALIARLGVGTLFVVPSMAAEMLRANVAASHDLSSLVLVGSTAAVLPRRLAIRLSQTLPNAALVNYYTSTEAMPAQTVMMFDANHPDSVGRPVAGKVAVRDERGGNLRPGEVGMVWLQVPTEPRRYLSSEDTGDLVLLGGWVRMGDYGYLDEAGYLYLVDRESDIIKTAGFKVSTLHIEAALNEHPDIVECAVFGVPDESMGVSVSAVVVAKQAVDLQEIRRFLMTRLRSHEIPTALVRVDQLPKNVMGKVSKRELRPLIASTVAVESL